MKKIKESPLIRTINDCISYFETNKDRVNCFPDIARELKTNTFIQNAEEIAIKHYVYLNEPLRQFIKEYDKDTYELPADLGKKVSEFVSYVRNYSSDKEDLYYMNTYNNMMQVAHYITGVFSKTNAKILADVTFDYVAVIIKDSILTIEFGLMDNNQAGILDEVANNIRFKKTTKVLGNTYLIKFKL